jgi:hypothetical protein
MKYEAANQSQYSKMAYASGKVNDLDDSNQQILSDINVQLL